MANKFHVSIFGELLHPWVNNPDTKFNTDGLFHVDLVAEGPDAEAMADKIEAASKAALAKHTDKMTPGEAKKWSLLLPFEREEDEAGNPTGRIAFSFKQNAKLKDRDGNVKDVKISLRDAANQEFKAAVYSGSEGRVKYSMRDIAVASTRKAGVRLDFGMVQVTRLQEAAGGFEEVEGGFVAGNTGGGSRAPADAGDDEGQY